METIGLFVDISAFLFCLFLFLGQKRSCSMFSPLFWYLIFHFVVFIFRPALGELFDFNAVWDYIGVTPDESDLALTHIVVAAGLISFTGGYFFSINKKSAVYSEKTTQNYAISTKTVVIVWLILGPIAIYSMLSAGLGISAGGANYANMTTVNNISINTNENGYILDAQFLLVGLCVILLYQQGFKARSFMPLLGFFFIRSYVGGGRWSIVLTTLAVALLYLYSKKKYWPPRRWIFYGLPIFALFGVLGQDRSFIRGLIDPSLASTTVEHSIGDSLLIPFQGPDFANFDTLTIILKFVPAVTKTYTYGVQYLQIFTEPIPRVWWPGKPVGAPIQLFNLNDYANFFGLTRTSVGDAWTSAGIVGVVLLHVAYGMFFATTYNWFMRNSHKPINAMMYICFCALFIQFFRDGWIISFFKFPALTIAPVVLAAAVNKFLGIKRGRQSLINDTDRFSAPANRS
ncbi:O-antigen polymerase [Burkholderia sp. BCC1993]|uniref:O-antigen polymerase n=1 Tax=Burkholderia sp. BCC1993 TaxID=2817444 RepID=UPI002AB2889F|nr:O-antigen polymerase [Burkholderia sp. BCC1993]